MTIGGKANDSLSMIERERIFDRDQCINVRSHRGFERTIKAAGASDFQGLNLDPQDLGGSLSLFENKRRRWSIRVS